MPEEPKKSPYPDAGVTSARHIPARTVEERLAALEERFAALEAQLKR
jgi:hypothetical protein